MPKPRLATVRTAAPSNRERLCRVFNERYDSEAWSNWRWQLRHRLTSLAQLEAYLELTDSERLGLSMGAERFAVSVTPHFAALMNPHDPSCPIRRQVVPTADEFTVSRGDMEDPCGEDHASAVEGLVHRYPDRVLLLALDTCASYCRYCTRSRLVSQGSLDALPRRMGDILGYLREHTEVRDVLLSGGDPLLMSDDRLDALLGSLREIEHIELLRIGSRVPGFLPQRVTPELAAVLRRHRVWLSLHFSHPAELTPEVASACDLLADSGIPLGSQTVLLRGVNDDAEVLKRLFHGLIKIRVRPYYLYQADPVVGTAHLRTSIERGLEIMSQLRGHTSGYAVPTYVVDAPGGGGKIPVQPETVVGRSGDTWQLRNWAGKVYTYVDPPEGS
ncbi:MAG TPA: KamA family radical SAM protein [Candidatus Sulfomarinibacteraceae bacterium]|nr:KamA family radical SAM protein [Candidatus Sulfomarinibacteraceae bacterium]